MTNLDPHDGDALRVFTGAIAGVIATTGATTAGLSGIVSTAVAFIIGAISVVTYRKFLTWTGSDEEDKETVEWPNWAS